MNQYEIFYSICFFGITEVIADSVEVRSLNNKEAQKEAFRLVLEKHLLEIENGNVKQISIINPMQKS